MADSRPVLLTVSGTIPPDLVAYTASGDRPRAGYLVMSDAFDADLVGGQSALASTGTVGRLLHRLGGAGAVIAWYCFSTAGATT